MIDLTISNPTSTQSFIIEFTLIQISNLISILLWIIPIKHLPIFEPDIDTDPIQCRELLNCVVLLLEFYLLFFVFKD